MKKLLVWLWCILPLVGYGFGKNKVIYYSYDWTIAFSPHFELYIPKTHTNLMTETLAILEEAYHHHEVFFGHSLKKKIQVILYPNQIDFLKNNIIPWTERGTEGFTELSRGRVALYYTPKRSEMKHYIYHELAHVFQLSLWSDPEKGGISFMNVPLWVVEGAAEWASVGATREGDRYVANLLYRGKLPTLSQLNELSRLEPYQYYLVYKMGALFYAFAEEKWGKEFFRSLVHALAKKRFWNKVLSEDFGTSEEALSREFREFVSKRYFPLYPASQVPKKIHEKETFEAHILWINSHEFLTMGVDRYYPTYLLYNTNTGSRKVLDKMGVSEQNLYFQYQRNHLSKSTNGLACWLVEGGDRYRLVIYDIQKKRKTTHTLPYRVFSSPDISPSGDEVVFIALEGKKHILALYNLRTHQTTPLVESIYVMDSPRWMSKHHIVVSANFHHGEESENMDLYLYDTQEKRWLWRMDSGESDEMPFVWEYEGKKAILFIQQGFFPSVCVYEPENRRLFSLYTHPGEMSFPVMEGKDLYLTLYDAGTMAIYHIPWEKETSKSPLVEENLFSMPLAEPKTLEPFAVKPYTYNLYPDSLFFIMSLNSYGDFGLAGIFAGSDTLGDHQVYALVDSIFVGADPRLAGWNFEVAYFFLKYRHQIGFRLLHYNNLFYEWIQFPDFYQVGLSYFDKWQSDFLYSYSFSTFQRFDGMVSYRTITYPLVENRQLILTNAQEAFVSGAYVFDNALDSGIGPLDGIRMAFSLEQVLPFNALGGFATRCVGDLRGYLMIVPGYGVATRLAGGTIFNYDPQRFPQLFFLGGHNSIRGYPYGVFRGDTAVVWNTEFRFPMIRYWQLGFPPIVLPTIWGVGFVDVGAIANRHTLSTFRAKRDDGRFENILASCGVGFRLVLGGEIKLMWNIAYPYDGVYFHPAVHEIVIARDF
ncbi:MAG: BamA/TamA family outer membrane protein [Brevinematales bacterium]|nr:BamA/TamA family outer membrane protein [Brevinematales bacterium]